MKIKHLLTLILVLIAGSVLSQMVQDSLTVQDHLFAGLSYSSLISGYIVAGVCLLLRWTWKTRKGVKDQLNDTPMEFSWSYWFHKNITTKVKSVLAVTISLYLFFRFGDEFIGEKFSIGLSAIIGLSLDYFIDKLKAFTPGKK